jgi:hypothetical protein
MTPNVQRQIDTTIDAALGRTIFGGNTMRVKANTLIRDVRVMLEGGTVVRARIMPAWVDGEHMEERFGRGAIVAHFEDIIGGNNTGRVEVETHHGKEVFVLVEWF